MKFTQRKSATKTGIQVLVRPAVVDDAQAILNLKRGYIKNTTTLPLTLNEYPDDLKKETKLITDYEESNNSIFLIAQHEQQLIGNLDLTGSKRIKTNHTAMIGMGIHQDWRNQGLGKILMECALDWAKNHSKITLVWLEVYATNTLGLHLYKSCGFKVGGIVENFFKEGKQYIDKIQLYQSL